MQHAGELAADRKMYQDDSELAFVLNRVSVGDLTDAGNFIVLDLLG